MESTWAGAGFWGRLPDREGHPEEGRQTASQSRGAKLVGFWALILKKIPRDY